MHRNLLRNGAEIVSFHSKSLIFCSKLAAIVFVMAPIYP